jgi:UDP-GlcNAc:undecaprenyl-phosphate GlcNAc-1-phosphate transferase
MTVRPIYYFISYFAAAFVLALALTPLIRPLAFKLGAVDTGTGRRVHTGMIPRLGGASIFLAFMMPAVFSLTRGEWDRFHYNLTGILIASALVLCIGIYDDLRGATVRNKLIAEILAAAVIYFWGIRIDVISNPFGPQIALGWMSLPVTVLWIIVITNAINLIDGLDGLAAGTGILISLTLFSLAAADVHMQLAFIVLAGSLAGFLVYNFPPASIFMGDSGSLFLGFFLAAISILSSHKTTAIATIMIPIVAFSFPLMDMFYAVLRRYYRGIPLGNADREHIHHKLLERGLSKRKVLFLLYFINISVMLSVLILVRRQLNVDFVGLILLVVFAIAGLRVFGYIEFMPFTKDMLRNYDIGRKSKYFGYVIKRFRQSAAKSSSPEELRSHLNLLIKEYNFNAVEIFLYPANREAPFYTYNSDAGPEPKNPLVLSFPIVGSSGPIGNVYISKDTGDDYFLCTAELVRAISEELSRFAKLLILNNNSCSGTGAFPQEE